MSGHKESGYPSGQTNIQYNPKTTMVEQRVDMGILKFDKMIKREIKLIKKSPYLYDTVDRVKVNDGYKIIDSNKSVPLFGRSKVFLEKYDPFGLPKFLLVFIYI